MCCIICYHRERTLRHAHFIINGLSVCRMTDHIKAASCGYDILDALEWLTTYNEETTDGR